MEVKVKTELIKPISEIRIEEENYETEKLLDMEETKNIIRIEMNTIEYPLFTKNKKIDINTGIKYIFNDKKNQFIEVIPALNSKIPHEFDERIFHGLMSLLRDQKYNRKVYFYYKLLMEKSGIKYSGRTLKAVKESLNRLATTSYTFNNCFYYNPNANILNREIKTKMLSIDTVTFEEAIKVSNNLSEYFYHHKIKELIEVTFDEKIFDNIISKGFLYFNAADLQLIEYDIARSLYTMITKWRNKALYIKRYSSFLASRIPLSWKKENINKSVKSIIKAFDELKEKKLISGYHFEKNKKYENSYFEIFFEKGHNKNLFLTHKTGQEQLQISGTENLSKSKLKYTAEITSDKQKITLEEFNNLVIEQMKKTNNMNIKVKPTKEQTENYLLQEYEII